MYKGRAITSVIIGLDPSDPDHGMMKMYFCNNCQNPIAKYKGFVFWLIPGLVEVELPVIHQCRNCKVNYNFLAIA